MASTYQSQRRPLPTDVRSRLTEIEQEYQAGELTQRGYEIRRSRLLSPFDLADFNLENEIPSGRLNNSAVHPHLLRRLTWLEWEC